MKSFCGLIAVLLVLHLQCGGSCLVESFATPQAASTAGQPPCHHQGGVPSKSPAPSRQTSGPCSQTSIVELKAATSKAVVLEFVAALPNPVVLSAASGFVITLPGRENPPGFSSFQTTPSILRI
jgi:hypothetical protein